MKVIEVAKKEVGYNEGENNYNKYAAEICPSLQNMAWCCIFIQWVFKKISTTLGTSFTGKCSELYLQMQKDRVTDPKEGDLIFFHDNGSINHIGLVTKATSSSVDTIEGNSQWKGEAIGGVRERHYEKSNARIYGYTRPHYSDAGKQKDIDATAYNGVVTATNVNIRSGPGTKYRKVGMKTKGDKIVISKTVKDSKNEDWYFIDIGYIKAEFAKFTIKEV